MLLLTIAASAAAARSLGYAGVADLIEVEQLCAAFQSHHYAFYVDDAEFDAVLQRVQAFGLPFGSAPWSIDDGKLNDWNGGRGFYFKDRDGHILELMTVPQ